MGFSLEQFFENLFYILDSDMKASRKIRELSRLIKSARESADYLIVNKHRSK